jgi:hypothetical protein
MMRGAAVLLAFALGWAPSPARAQAPAAAVHGENSVFVTPDAVMVWAILRAAREEDSEVVIRVAAPRFARLRVEAVDPFGGGRREVLPPQALRGVAEVRRRRADFAEHPRLEIRLEPPPGAGAPAPLLVYYLGVPDTAPELTSEAALQRYLADALDRARPAR